MPTDKLTPVLSEKHDARRLSGWLNEEAVITGVLGPAKGRGPRFLVDGYGERPFLRMNSASYLGLSLATRVMEAAVEGVRRYGVGAGGARSISGSWEAHVKLEKRLAQFHGRDAAMLFNSAYAVVMGTLPALISKRTVVISDVRNNSSIGDAIGLARPAEKCVYDHLDIGDLTRKLGAFTNKCRRAVVVTDGVFAMQGDHARLDEVMRIARQFHPLYAEGVIVVADDAHGVGAFGATGRGTEEIVGAKVDVLIGALGNAFGVNGGYVVAAQPIIDYLRQVSLFYIYSSYSSPIAPGEAESARAAVDRVDSEEGRALLGHLRAMTQRFRAGLLERGLETLDGEHPIVPLLVRDPAKAAALVDYLRGSGVLASGLTFPAVQKGAEQIRFQISADHSTADIDAALAVLDTFHQARGAA